MASTTTALMILILLIFDYLVLYRKNRLFGNMMYMVTGLGIWWKFPDADFVGYIIMIGGLVSLIYDLMSDK